MFGTARSNYVWDQFSWQVMSMLMPFVWDLFFLLFHQLKLYKDVFPKPCWRQACSCSELQVKMQLVWACLAQSQFSAGLCRDMWDYRGMWERWKFKEKLRGRKQQEATVLLSAQRECDLWWQLAVSEAGNLFMNIAVITGIVRFINHDYRYYDT